jgi:hypothetical protein
MKNQEEFIFRYRPTKSFNKYNELQNQEIYFGALGELKSYSGILCMEVR